ncbi:hypothetical protein [uncultured Jannaschia sp.]|uniref:hypothetical protein n=1 Tax=uncultured Jannaschia sp. TaxID=293347 RepID=UPI00341F21EA
MAAEGSAPTDATDANPGAGLNIVAFILSGREIDPTEIVPALLRDMLHEADGAEANIATGDHAIEFPLRDQDPAFDGGQS